MASRLIALLLLCCACSLSQAQKWTLLPNTRCHNDIGQTHNVSSVAACEYACLGTDGCSLFTYCPPGGAPPDCVAGNGGPEPATCWLYPLSELPSCATDVGWTSGWTLPLPPRPPPSDWAARIAQGQMAYTPAPPEEIGPGWYPVVANGNLGLEVGPFVQAFVNAWPWRDAGMFKLSGVYSGYNYTTPSHRAQIPRLTDVTLVRQVSCGPLSHPAHPLCCVTSLPALHCCSSCQAGVYYEAIGVAIDWGVGIYYNRTLIVNGTPGASCDNTIIEQRSYAHRALRELFVYEIRAFAADASRGWAGCSGLPVDWTLDIAGLGDTLLNETLGSASVPTTWAGTTTVPEEPGLPLRSIAIAFDSWVALGPKDLSFTPTQPILSLHAVLRSDLDVAEGASPSAVAAAASNTWLQYASQTSEALLASHISAMASLWESGVELTGNATFAASVNASLYDIVASLRSDWNWSTSPGGIATGGYSGHSFWDMETWMFPVLTVLYPDLGRVAAQYRFDRLGASEQNAAAMGYDGAAFSWESAFTGLWASPWRQADYSENHLDVSRGCACQPDLLFLIFCCDGAGVNDVQ
jgi:hypothetical protein